MPDPNEVSSPSSYQIQEKVFESDRFHTATLTLPSGYEVKLNPEQSQNFYYASKAAQSQGIPEQLFIRILYGESGLRSRPGGNDNGGGVGQFTDIGAEDVGTTPATIRDNPQLNIQKAAQLVKNSITYMGLTEVDLNNPDIHNRIAAAYYVGPGSVNKAQEFADQKGGIWQDYIDSVSEKDRAGQVSVFDYLKKTTGGGYSGGSSKLGGSSSKQNQNSSTGYNATGGPPSPSDPQFYFTNADGTQSFDTALFSQAKILHNQAVESQRTSDFAGDSQYIDDVITEYGLNIEAGKTTVSQAIAGLNTRMSAYRTALDYQSSRAYGYGVAPDAKYIPGDEPGGYYSTIAGKPEGMPLDRGSLTFMNPMAEALATNQQARETLNWKPPELSNITQKSGSIVDQLSTKNTATPSGNPFEDAQRQEKIDRDPYRMRGS